MNGSQRNGVEVHRRRLAAAAGCVLVIALGAARLAWSEGPVEVSLTEDRLSIRAHGAAAADVLAEVTKVTGVRFAIDPEARLGSVDVEIGPMDPERAIRSLVGSIPGVAGSAASYSKGANGRSQLVRLSLFGPGQAPGGSVAPPVRAPPFEDRPPAHGTDPEEENEGQPPAPPPPPAAPLPNVEGHRPRAPDDDARAASPRRLRAAGPRWERTVAV